MIFENHHTAVVAGISVVALFVFVAGAGVPAQAEASNQTIELDGPTSATVGESVEFEFIGDHSSVYVDFGDDSLPMTTSESAAHSYGVSGAYELTATVIDDDGNSFTELSHDILVFPDDEGNDGEDNDNGDGNGDDGNGNGDDQDNDGNGDGNGDGDDNGNSNDEGNGDDRADQSETTAIYDELHDLTIRSVDYEDGRFDIVMEWSGRGTEKILLTEMVELDSSGSIDISMQQQRLRPGEPTEISISAEQSSGTAAVLLTTEQSRDHGDALLIQEGEPSSREPVPFNLAAIAVIAAVGLMGGVSIALVVRKKNAEERGRNQVV